MVFARRVFGVAGIYGLLVLLPQYFTEAKTGADFPPPITHPEYYYGFVGVAVAWQVLFLILARDPHRRMHPGAHWLGLDSGSGRIGRPVTASSPAPITPSGLAPPVARSIA